jgi:plastocyanin
MPKIKLLTGGAVALVAVALLTLPALAAPTAQTIRVIERDYRISLSARPKPGPTVFVVRNSGEDGHDFWLRGGGKTYRSRVLATGGTARLRVTLKRGVRYQYWCGVGSHASKGMRGSFVAR